jgi:hypothetical protein
MPNELVKKIAGIVDGDYPHAERCPKNKGLREGANKCPECHYKDERTLRRTYEILKLIGDARYTDSRTAIFEADVYIALSFSKVYGGKVS